MRKILVLALSVVALVACEKEKTDAADTTGDTAAVVDTTNQDAVAAPDSATPVTPTDAGSAG